MRRGKNKQEEPVLVIEADSPVLDAGDMLPEYDFSQMKEVRDRGHYAKKMRKGYTTIVNHPDGTKEITHYRPLEGCVALDRDVREYFPDADAVNTALRGLIALVPTKRRAQRRRAQAEKD
jgi:hypothetical protein